MRIVRANDLDKPLLRTQVCVVGAGAAGLFIGNQLESAGIEFVILEAADEPTTSDDIDFTPHFSGTAYAGATAGRMFGLGGTTSVWGGKLANYDAGFAPENTGSASDWAHIVNICTNNALPVLRSLGCESSFTMQELEPHEKVLLDAGFAAAKSFMLPPRRKNFSFLARGRSGLLIVSGVAGGWLVDSIQGDAVIRSLSVIRCDGRPLTIEADEFIVAAGTLESTRLILELEAISDQILPPSAELGQGLGDHLSAPIVELRGETAKRAQKDFAPRFDRRFLSTTRFSDLSGGYGGRHFLHVVFHLDGAEMNVLRSLISAIQRKAPLAISPHALVSALPGLARVAFDRAVHNRLYIPEQTKTFVQLDVEQPRSLDRNITLSGEKDRWGRRRALVRWGISDSDIELFHRVRSSILPKLPFDGANENVVSADPSGIKLYDAYHPVGTLRAGEDPGAVVDRAFRVRRTTNLRVVSTAVFPSAGAANPTFPMLCVAFEVVRELQKRFA